MTSNMRVLGAVDEVELLMETLIYTKLSQFTS